MYKINTSPLVKVSLSISCVTFNSNQVVLNSTIESLASSCAIAKNNGILDTVELYLIDNGSNEKNLSIIQLIKTKYKESFNVIHILTGQGNIGYGKGNNLAINKTQCSYHLIINPDVIVGKENISRAINYLTANSGVAMVVPCAQDQNKKTHYIAKRYPGLMVLMARALKLSFLQQLLHARLNDYEYRDKIPAQYPIEIELASGCYMFCRADTLKKIGGFDPCFFMYFEDFDLSIRLRKTAKIIHLADLQVIHYGGGASTKGLRHVFYFCVSLCQFFSRHHFKF